MFFNRDKLTFVLLDGLVGDEVGVHEPVAAVRRVPRHHEAIHGDVRERNVAGRAGEPLVGAHRHRRRPRAISRRIER